MSGPSIDDTGFHVHEYGGVTGLQGWLDRLTDGKKSRYGNDIDVSPESQDGQELAAQATELNNLEQVALTLYLMNAPAGAVGAALSRLLGLNGLTRKGAEFSIVPITLSGTPSTVVPINSLFDDPDDPDLPPFKTVAAYTIGGGGTVTGQGICTVAGPYNLGAKTMRILTIESGWNSVATTSAAAPGRLVETDPIARVRRSESVALPSQGILDGLHAGIANLSGVDDVAVYMNSTGAYDVKGHPPHSVHAIVDGGIDADIANAIWVKTMGETKVGSLSFVITDTQGNPQEMRWDVPVDVNVYITVQLSRNPTSFETDSIKAALVAFGDETSRIGRNVPWGDLFSPINDLNITGGPGMPSILQLRLDDSATPVPQEDLIVAFNARPRYDASRINVVGP